MSFDVKKGIDLLLDGDVEYKIFLFQIRYYIPANYTYSGVSFCLGQDIWYGEKYNTKSGEIYMNQRYGNIIGWGKYVPENVLTNADLEKMVDTNDEAIVKLSGIKERRIASEDENTSSMATAASRQALNVAGIRPKDLDLIIVATSSPAVYCHWQR